MMIKKMLRQKGGTVSIAFANIFGPWEAQATRALATHLHQTNVKCKRRKKTREGFELARDKGTNRWSMVEPEPRHVKSHATAALPLPFSHMCCVIATTPSLLISSDLSRMRGTTVSMKFLINPPCDRIVGAGENKKKQRRFKVNAAAAPHVTSAATVTIQPKERGVRFAP